MGILNGEPVNAAYTNPAFLDRRLDDTAIGKYTLANTDPISGSSVTNIQRELNSEASFTGNTLNSVYNNLPTYVNNDVGSANDSLRTRADALTGKFNSTTGHTHDGTTGQGPQISAANLANVPYRGYWLAGLDILGVTGSSVDVSSQMVGLTPNGGPTVIGVVTDPTNNKLPVVNASGPDENEHFHDSSGNLVYGRITYAASVWTLSFYVLVGNTETAYSFASSSDVRWYYQHIYNPMIYAPTYSELTYLPSENVTADVITATQALQGKVLLSSSAGSDIGSSGSIGTANATVANSDHTHRGVRSLAKQGSTQLFGDVTLSAGDQIILTQTGQNIEIKGTGALGYQETPAGLVNGINTTFGPLTYLPSNADSIIVFIDSLAIEKTNWTLSGNNIVFSSNIPQTGQSVYVFYITSGIVPPPPVVTGILEVEYRTLSAGEITAKQLTLTSTPVTGSKVIVDIIGGGPQVYNVDYTVAGAVLSWPGYGLDGLISAGDILRVQYVY